MTVNDRRTQETKGQRFARLYLENWRNFQKADLALQRRVFLIGPNASGKSNLLDVFRFLHDIVVVGGGFQQAVKKRGGVSAIRRLAARKHPDIVIRAELAGDKAGGTASYELRFKQDSISRPVIGKECVIKNGKKILSRPDDDDKADPERLTQTYLEQDNVNRELRDIAEFFSSVRYLHEVFLLVPGKEGTETNPASSFRTAPNLDSEKVIKVMFPGCCTGDGSLVAR